MTSFVIHVIVSIGIAYPFLSLMEYLIHRNLMHRPKLAKMFNNKYLLDTFREHAVLHHSRCYDVLDRDVERCYMINITIKPSTALIVIAIPCLILLLIDEITSFFLLTGAIINSMIWSKVHSEIHRPKGAWFSRTTVYKYLKRWHFLHHRHPQKNFNSYF